MMSDFNYTLDVDEDYQGGLEEGQFDWDNTGPPPGPSPGPLFNTRRPHGRQNMDSQYSEAFGDYRGGYGPGCGYGPGNGYGRGGGFGPHGGFGPRGGFGPSGAFGPSGGFGPERFRPYPPGPIRGRGYGPFGPHVQRTMPVHKAAKFLAKCEIAKEYIKPLPRQLLDLIEPEYCGLCAQNLDSFAVAKIHYNCKNHYKAQKKYLALRKEFRKNIEVPMKARNLYCELCDVHITSVSHADSHYAGRSHRAIVDGRKPPKNPMLLQEGMEFRVDQLLRREKKNQKTTFESEIIPEFKDIAEKKVNTELACEICMTTVTCSEQMTSHLNGKKHLTKEKQHILKMMKGKAVENANKKNDSNANEVEVVADDDEDEDTQKEAEDQTEISDPAEKQVEDWSSGGGLEWDAQNTSTEIKEE